MRIRKNKKIIAIYNTVVYCALREVNDEVVRENNGVTYTPWCRSPGARGNTIRRPLPRVRRRRQRVRASVPVPILRGRRVPRGCVRTANDIAGKQNSLFGHGRRKNYFLFNAAAHTFGGIHRVPWNPLCGECRGIRVSPPVRKRTREKP